MIAMINPTTIMQPFNNVYSHATVIPPGARVLHSAGQIGGRPDGSVPASAEDQAEQVWPNLLAILGAADMQATDIVKLTAYVVDAAHYPAYAAARTRALGSHRPASTAICIPALLKPEWLMEVEMIAARAP
jgi:enamine deaminase RidA (YjgF/YER057c/UK114 family)